MSDDEKRWYEDMVRCGWEMPIVSRWKKLPGIRHLRTWFHMLRINRHYAAMQATGLGMLDTGYDSWVLYGMWHGREGSQCTTCKGDGQGGAYYRDGSPTPCPTCRGNGVLSRIDTDDQAPVSLVDAGAK